MRVPFVRRTVVSVAPILAVVSVLWAPSVVRAQVRVVTWIGASGANWNDDTNWLDDRVPPQNLQPFPSDHAIIPASIPLCNTLENILSLEVAPTAGIDLAGTLAVNSGAVANHGVITVGSDGDGTFSLGPGTLGGAGAVELISSDFLNPGGGATVGGPTGAMFATHAATHTIRGEGTVNGNWINNGLIRAEEASGDSAATFRLLGTMTNNGVIRSSSTAMVLQLSTLTMGAGGQFIADGQNILLGGSVSGGAIDAINGAKFVHPGTGTTVLSGVTINGDYDVLVNNAGVAVTGTGVTNNGNLTLDNQGAQIAELSMAVGATLGGSGQVILNRGNDGTRISGNFTQGANHTIRGAGRIQATIVNNGSIIAEVRNGTLLRTSNSTITNNSLLQANDGAILRFELGGSVTQGAAGRIRAASGGTVQLQSMVVSGGKLQTAGTGVIVGSAGNSLTDVTNEGAYHVQTGSTTRINGSTLTNNGVMTVNPTGAVGLTALEFASNVVLQGTGSIVLNQAGTSARITTFTATETVTQAAGHTIRGRGVIATGTAPALFVNNGRLEGNSSTELLEVLGRMSGGGSLKDVRIGGQFTQIEHILGGLGTTAVVPVEGMYDFARNSSLLVDLAGPAPGAGYDQLNATGPVALSATATRLEVSLAGGFFPSIGQAFTLITTTGALTGSFGTVVLPSVAPDLAWIRTQTSSAYTIRTTWAADFDEDGDVDALDLAVWKAGYGPGAKLHTQGDADGDGDVDGADVLIWQRQLGNGLPVTPTAAIPEPASGILLALALAAACAAGRSRPD